MNPLLRSALVVGLFSLTGSGPAFGLGVPLDLDWEHFDWEPPRWNERVAKHTDFGSATDFARDFAISRHLETFRLPTQASNGSPGGSSEPADDWHDDGTPGDDTGPDRDGYPGEDPGDGGGMPGDDDGIPGKAGLNGNGHIEHGNGNGYGHCSHGNGNGYGHAYDDCGPPPVPEPSAALLMGALFGALALVRRRSA